MIYHASFLQKRKEKMIYHEDFFIKKIERYIISISYFGETFDTKSFAFLYSIDLHYKLFYYSFKLKK